MSKNEKTSKSIATIASKILRGEKATQKEIKKVAASALTQRPNKKGK